MQIDRRVQRFGPLPEWIERWVIEIDPIAVAVDHDAAEAELADAALELVGGYAWILQRYMPEPGIAVRPPLDLPGQEVVALPGLAAGRRGAGLDLHAGTRKREDCTLDPGLIHLAKAVLAEVPQARHDLPVDGRVDIADCGLPVVLEAGTQEVLFERDFSDHGLLGDHFGRPLGRPLGRCGPRRSVPYIRYWIQRDISNVRLARAMSLQTTG